MRRARTDGRHLSVESTTFIVKGVTYGSFLRRADGQLFPDDEIIDHDFAAMAAAGMNTVRVYTAPPPSMLDLAGQHGLRLIVGLDYHDLRMETGVSAQARRRVLSAGRRAVDDALDRLAGRPEVLAVSVGNEFPSDLVRLHGAANVERLLGDLVDRLHDGDPELLVTYTNYPTTEYLDVPGLDLVTFNVFLESQQPFRRYLRHLQIISGARPMILTELGLAAELVGDDAQAASLAWQLDTIDELGLAGATIFSWTDDWAVGGQRVEGWGFGLTHVDRTPRPAFEVASAWARRKIVDSRVEWPKVSVIVCAYNEESTIAECLESLTQSPYPDLEVIVCDDGSTDQTGSIAQQFAFKYLPLPHGGLSRARNAGLEVASGEIIAYLDADAACHPHWPFYLAQSFHSPSVVASGGPNLPFDNAGLVERAVSLSPGAPTEVLVSDDRAEHVAGCNMAFRANDLRAIGGFDPTYTSAGDDVDVGWKLLDRGGHISFSPAAQVRHHRRNSVRRYLRQQRGYGRAERLLLASHPHRFNRLGQARWMGFIYGNTSVLPRLLRPVVYHGTMGTGPYQPVVTRRADVLAMWATALMPLVPVAFAVALVAALIEPGLVVVPVAIAVMCASLFIALAVSVPLPTREPHPWRLRTLVAALHFAQPVVRTWGRIRGPSRRVAKRDPEWKGDRWTWLHDIIGEGHQRRLTISPGGAFDRWDLVCSVGPFVQARISTAVVWGWIPRHRVAYRLRRTPLFLIVLAVAVIGRSEPLIPLAASGVALALVAETLVLRYRVRAMLAASLRSYPRPTRAISEGATVGHGP